ncbi:unnamed protein product [Moneuplotes crassus]|uniref:Uncharacterized protein n=1 Tax=Euplotes crassus TaxID=5936 RepID=A0AAD1X809_EUPCR|nr:unnamed protein product [Moneuplotes crassus]
MEVKEITGGLTPSFMRKKARFIKPLDVVLGRKRAGGGIEEEGGREGGNKERVQGLKGFGRSGEGLRRCKRGIFGGWWICLGVKVVLDLRIESQDDLLTIESAKYGNMAHEKNFDQEQSYGLYKSPSIEIIKNNVNKYSFGQIHQTSNNILENLKNKRRIKKGTIFHKRKSSEYGEKSITKPMIDIPKYNSNSSELYNLIQKKKEKKTSSMTPMQPPTNLHLLSLSADSTSNLDRSADKLPLVNNNLIFTGSSTDLEKPNKPARNLFKLQGRGITNRSISVSKNGLCHDLQKVNQTQIDNSGMIISTCDEPLLYTVGSRHQPHPNEIKNIRKCLEEVVKIGTQERIKISKPSFNSFIRYKKNELKSFEDKEIKGILIHNSRPKKQIEQLDSSFLSNNFPSFQAKQIEIYKKSWKEVPMNTSKRFGRKSSFGGGSTGMEPIKPKNFLSLISKQKERHKSIGVRHKRTSSTKPKVLKLKSPKPSFGITRVHLPKSLKRVESLNEDLIQVTTKN